MGPGDVNLSVPKPFERACAIGVGEDDIDSRFARVSGEHS